MNRTLTKKLMYVIVVLALLAMMIPAMAVPVSAANTLSMVLVDPVTHNPQTTPEGNPGWNITGSIVEITANLDPNWSITGWNLINVATAPSAGPAAWVGGQPAPGTNPVRVQGIWGDAEIQAFIMNSQTSANDTLSIEKKWGQIDHTVFTPQSNFSYVTWSEATKSWTGNTTITDTVWGSFYEKDPIPPTGTHIVSHVAAGTILDWYLVPGNAVVSMAAGNAATLNAAMLALSNPGPSHVNFLNDAHHVTTVSGTNGASSVTLMATGEEAVQVVVIPSYPFGIVNINVTPEVTPYAFFTTEMDVVPQVRWAGEKIVLEKNFGSVFSGRWVNFALQNQSVGSLEIIGNNGQKADQASVWTQVSTNGTASVILVSSDEGVSQVTAALYSGPTPAEEGNILGNQHFFTVYFLKFESLTLGDVQGKREFHDSGLWQLPSTIQPTDPWDPAGTYNGTTGNSTNPQLADMTTQTLNVSQDALLRARVRGWFTSANPSVRPERQIDPTNSTLDNPTTATLLLPRGRWILPDDWATLAGPNWQQSRLHWDIMCNPDGSVGVINTGIATAPDVYKKPPITGVAVSGSNVIGPFSPGLELMTPKGWTIPNPGYDPQRPINTVVPDGKLNIWDAPMPPAKIIFQIQGAPVVTGSTNMAGYFKPADKGDIYYKIIGTTKVYVNPFYQEMIPAHEAIPPFINNGGYDWDSFDPSYGAYMFWEFINQHTYTPMVPTTDPSGHPTNVEVYSDNHGEAMVWLNGNWNLDLSAFFYKAGTIDPWDGATVGHTTIQATADYPYSRIHQAVQSNLDVKTWLWGGQVLGTDSHTFPGTPVMSTNKDDTRMVLSAGSYDVSSITGIAPNQAALSTDKVVWVWVTDRDGGPEGVNGAMVTWTVSTISGSGAKINNVTGSGISQYNAVTQGINLQNGFLENGILGAPTNGYITDGANRMHGVSFLRPPTSFEKQLFNKFWGTGGTSSITDLDPNDYVVAAIDLLSLSGNASRAQVNIDITSHDFDQIMGQMVPGTVQYETNVDFSVADALDDGIRTGDANCDGFVNMGDVTTVERMILGYNRVTSNAILNNDGSVDMGTVVKIERTILGLK